MMKIVIAGRPNTGKSTLFNALTGTRDALVHDRPGVTRDTICGNVRNRPYMLYDTAGLERDKTGIAADSTNMAIDAVQSADAVLFVVDGRVGLTNWFAEKQKHPCCCWSIKANRLNDWQMFMTFINWASVNL